MHRLAWLVVACVACAGVAAAAVEIDKAQGLYEGTVGDQKAEARLVAVKEGFKLLIRPLDKDSTAPKIELNGKVEGDSIVLSGGGAEAKWGDFAVSGKAGDKAIQLKRVERLSPTLGLKPPAGAVVILDGKNFDELVKKPLKGGQEQEWKIVEEGAIQVPKGGMNTKRQFAGSFKYHVEFRCPLMPPATSQGRGNSGCFLPNGEEIQVLDSFGMNTYTGGGCGGLYKYKDPDTFDVFSLASAPPLQWQTYDVEYRVEVKDGKPAGKPRLTVLHNGIKIHDNVELKKDARPGNLNWQDHGNPVCYRNIWVLEEK